MKSNIVRNILLHSASALVLCAGPTMAVAGTTPHFVPAAPIAVLPPPLQDHESVYYTIHQIQTLDPLIQGKGTFRLTHGNGMVEAWTVHQLSTGKTYRTGYAIRVERSKNGTETVFFSATVHAPTMSTLRWHHTNRKPAPPKVPSLLVIVGKKTDSLSSGPDTIPCGSGVSVTISEKG